MTLPDLADIPLIDLREGGPVLQAERSAARARALRDDCLSFFPAAAALLLPALDALARRWLTRSRAPYIDEIERIAARLGFSGVWFLNGSYQWGCTALSRVEGGQPWLVRSLDWPFPGLGRHVEIAHKRGPAGDFHSVTWPGYVGTLTGMAASRFAACINQAPLHRRTRHPWLRLFDLAANAVATWGVRHIPPDQLLRQVFETCPDFAAARRMLETTPVARPVIFSLVGTKGGEACVIERTEDAFVTHAGGGSAANDWRAPRPDWEARVGGDMLLSSRFDEAAANSRTRQEALLAYRGSLRNTPFGWLSEPVLNRYTRLGVEMCPARGLLRVTGFEPQASGAPARAVTRAAMLENLAA